MKHWILYALVLAVFGLGIHFALDEGRRWVARPALNRPVEVAADRVVAKPGEKPVMEPLSRLLLQVVLILIATRCVGEAFNRIGQPAVVGEMFAGVMLGPSFLGFLAPGAFQFLFPASSLETLKMLSQIGVCLFLFVVGLDLDVNQLGGRAHAAVLVSHSSMVVPFFLGVVLSIVLFEGLAGPGTSFTSFALFLGISMSITAFPVLARILQERGMEKTPLGVMALTCAAVDDVTAWGLLAFVVAIVRATGLDAVAVSLGGVVVYVVLMLGWLRPRLAVWLGDGGHPGSHGPIATVLVIAFTSALTTEWIGIHALFGAFLAGVVMPQRKEFRAYLKLRLETVGLVFLLPLFFAVTGLRTQVGLLQGASDWGLCGLILLVACAGKMGGTLVAARFSGMNWSDSFSLGALMNTRGLMELVAINIGYDLGTLSPQIFAMLVIMALATTFMTGPLLGLAERLKLSSGWARSGSISNTNF